MQLTHANTKRFTNDEVTRLWELGAFGNERIELVEGQIVLLQPREHAEVDAIINSTEVLVVAFRETHRVGVQVPLKLSEHSGPEPDFYLLPRTLPAPQPDAGPRFRRADLVVEVAATSLSYDRDEKSSLYASYAIKEYWILNVVARQLEVYRDPRPEPDRVFGHGYTSVTVLDEASSVSPLVRPDVSLRIGDLL